ncbi:MAG: response regulator, partial [Methanogenium sp.]|nr:response regulator [Methanogenium sp.]
MCSAGPLHKHLPEWHKPPQNRINYFRLYVNFKLMMDGTVLIVDDEPDLLELTKIYLEKTGDFTVDTAASACEAMEMIKATTYDAIVSDYQMPEMDGIE